MSRYIWYNFFSKKVFLFKENDLFWLKQKQERKIFFLSAGLYFMYFTKFSDQTFIQTGIKNKEIRL